jgi:hypothetical protein
MSKSFTRNGYCDIWRIKIISGGTFRVAIHQPESAASPVKTPLIADALAAFQSMDGFKGMQVESATLESECPVFDLKEGE